mgnify:CR=1 FL=1
MYVDNIIQVPSFGTFIFIRKNYLLFKDIYQNVDDYDELFNGRLFSNNNQNNNIDI